MKKSIKAFIAIGIVAIATVFFTTTFTKASTTDNIVGYAWSSNIGWISTNNCTSAGACTGPSYGVTMAATGTPRAITGYAWSSNIGWVSFNGSDTAGCPASIPADTNCQARVVWGTSGGTSVAVRGWARACSVFVSGCSGALKPTSSSGGWDGFIALHDTNTSDSASFGVTFNTSTNQFMGYAWGSEVVGWVDLANVKLNIPPPPPVDICTNLAGVQTTVPAGYNPPDANGVCSPILVCQPPLVDTGGQCACPVGTVLYNGQCIRTSNCPGTVVDGVCIDPTDCAIGEPCWCPAHPSDTVNCPPSTCQFGSPCYCTLNPDEPSCKDCDPGQVNVNGSCEARCPAGQIANVYHVCVKPGYNEI